MSLDRDTGSHALPERFENSLRARFAAASFPVILLLVVGVYFAFDAQLTKIIADLSQRFAIQQVTYDRWRTVQPLLQEVALARNLARSRAIIEWALDERNATKSQRGIAELENTREIFRDRSYFFAIHASGNYFFNDAQNAYAGKQYRYTLSPSKADDAWYYATIRNPVECQLNVNNDTELRVTKIWINCLVQHEGRVVGVIGTGLDLTGFISLVLEAKQPGVLNMFIDGDGAIQAHPDRAVIDFHTLTKAPSDKKTVYQLMTDKGGAQALSSALSELKENPGAVRTLDLKIGNEEKLVGISYIPEIKWFNVTVISSRVWALGQSFAPLALLTVTAVILTLLFGAVIIHKLVLSRISRLDRAVAAIRRNTEAPEISDPVPDEIGRLGESLNRMAKAVSRNRHMLEDEVRERTRMLAAARDEAEAASAAKSQFLANMTHELKTPLNAIIGFSAILAENQKKKALDPEYQDFGRDILKAGNYLNSLITDILDLSKIEAGRYQINSEAVPAHRLLDDALLLVSHKSAIQDVSVTSSISPDDLVLWVDRRAFLQIVINLVSNAVKFSPPKSEVRIGLEQLASGQILLSVKDQGLGIEASDKPMLFEPFVRGRNATDGQFEGTGLGLTITKRLVELHKGDISLEGQAGTGTLARVLLPSDCGYH